MNRFAILPALCALLIPGACTQEFLSPDDLNAPSGFATCTNLHGGRYNLTGGFKNAARGVQGKQITLISDALDSKSRIEEAIALYDIIVLDGSAGPFIYSETSMFTGIQNKTIVGINGAVLQSKFQCTPEIKEVLAHAGEKFEGKVTPEADGRWRLSNDSLKRDFPAFAANQALIDYTGDSSMPWLKSGFFSFGRGCSNIIIRNIFFDGPGSVRGLPHLMIRFTQGANHAWVDHCTFEDFARVGIGAARQADCITVSWCEFRCTEQSNGHTLANLISSGDDNWFDEDYLNFTFDHCKWTDVWSRIPMARFGTIHINNCLYDCPGTVGINPRQDSEFLVEGCWFEKDTKPLCRYKIEDTPPKAYVFRDNVFDEQFEAGSKGEVHIPYKYVTTSPMQARQEVAAHVGPTLRDPLKISR